MKRSELPDQKYLKECFDYNKVTGELFWKERPLNHFKLEKECKRFKTNFAGKIAGRQKKDGYLEVRLDGKYYSVHRVIYKIVTGDCDIDVVDHINGIKNDNKWENLRKANSQQNNFNRKTSLKNTSGYKGVSVDKNTGKYKSSIRIPGGERIFLGYFDCPIEAHEAYCTSAKLHHKEFFNNGEN